MTPERWAQVNEVLQRAFELAPEKRAGYLDSTCAADASLRREVESLLAADQQARSSFLQSSPAGLIKGTKLGDYEVLSKLGAGGMGEVYRALDVRLRREVAIKILTGFASSNPERLRRFEQEAMAAAALNHPNILAVYQMGTHEGVPYLVSELLEGETLRELVRRGRIVLRKAIDFGVQIAHGLATAHQKGVVHRDLKPENLFVTKDGRAKILDFGLAKLSRPQSSSVHSALTVGSQTEPGMVMGTVGYMSPEQVRGQAADHRADIFAFGAILYEMLTGLRAFQKPTSAETMAAILNEEPALISQIGLKIPPGLQRVVHRCLEKNPEQRYHSASDLAFALEALSDSDAASSAAVERARRALFGKPLLIKFALVSLLVVLATAGFFALRHRYTTQSLKPKDLEIALLTHTGNAIVAAISPDARYVAYAFSAGDKAKVIVRQVTTGSEVEIVPSESRFYGGLTFSPDGNYIYIVRSEPSNSDYANLYRIPTLGGAPILLLHDLDSPVVFSPDGRQMAYVRGVLERNEFQLLVAAPDGSGERVLLKQPVFLASPTRGPNLFGPAWSPDGKFVAFTAYDPTGNARSIIRSVSITDGSVRDIYSSSDDMGRPLWLPDGSGFVVPISEHARNQRAQLWFISYPAGEPHRIIDDLNDYDIDSPSLSVDGSTLILTEKAVNSDLWIAPAGDTSQAEPITSNGFAERLFSWTPDGKILFADRDGNLFRLDRDGTQRILLNPDQHRDWAPSACGDGRHVIFESYRDLKVGLWMMNPDGSNLAPLNTPPFAELPQCSPDGKWIVYQVGLNAFRLSLESQGAGLAIGSASAWSPRVSPDNNWMAYIAIFRDTSKPPRLQVASFPDGRVVHELPWIASIQEEPRWTPDSKAIQRTVTRKGTSNIWEQKLGGGPEKQITYFKSGRIFDFEWSPDGKFLALTRGSLNREVVMIRNFR
ncbi:MAG TPA: protein kinase [Candidatus Sulfotelmatobacter sp.]|nr:protein kinase [Candidatus Sulfotelmatobacter sp.]